MSVLSWVVLGLVVGVLAKWIMPGADPGGLVMTIVLGVVGAFVGGWESLMDRIPVVRSIYSAAKNFAEIVFSDSSSSFKQVMLIEYPRKFKALTSAIPRSASVTPMRLKSVLMIVGIEVSPTEVRSRYTFTSCVLLK